MRYQWPNKDGIQKRVFSPLSIAMSKEPFSNANARTSISNPREPAGTKRLTHYTVLRTEPVFTFHFWSFLRMTRFHLFDDCGWELDGSGREEKAGGFKPPIDSREDVSYIDIHDTFIPSIVHLNAKQNNQSTFQLYARLLKKDRFRPLQRASSFHIPGSKYDVPV